MMLIYTLLIGASQFMFFVSCPCIYNSLPFHFRFEVPLRPELWSSYAMGGSPRLHLHQQPNPTVRRRRQVSDEPNNARGRKKSVRRKRNDSEDPSGVFMADAGARGRKTSRSSHCNSRGKNLASDKSRRLTDYFHAQGNREVMKLVTNCINRITNSYVIHNAYSHIRLLSFFMLHSILCIGQYNPSHCLCLSSHTPIYRSL